MIERVVAAAHARGRKVGGCGELAADPRGARVLAGLGVDAISVSIAHFANVKLSLCDATFDECRKQAQSAMNA
jgi:phosphocarrier protein FPr